MIPGFGQQMANMPIDEEELPRSEDIILSMTPFERYHPEVLNTSRRERIASGAGVELEDVNELMRGFKEMKQQFAEMRKMGILGNLLDPTRKLKKEKERELERMKRMGVNLFDPAQVRAFKQFSERKARQEARRNKRRKRG
jgi:signal recognition particle GTPase